MTNSAAKIDDKFGIMTTLSFSYLIIRIYWIVNEPFHSKTYGSDDNIDYFRP